MPVVLSLAVCKDIFPSYVDSCRPFIVKSNDIDETDGMIVVIRLSEEFIYFNEDGIRWSSSYNHLISKYHFIRYCTKEDKVSFFGS